MILGAMDDTHFPWVHEGILGNQDHPEPPDHEVWREGSQLVLRYEAEQPAGLFSGGAGDGPVKLLYIGMPNVIRLVKNSPGGCHVIWLTTCPLGWNRTRSFWIVPRNDDMAPGSGATFTKTAPHVRIQDRAVIESQRPWLLPPV